MLKSFSTRYKTDTKASNVSILPEVDTRGLLSACSTRSLRYVAGYDGKIVLAVMALTVASHSLKLACQTRERACEA